MNGWWILWITEGAALTIGALVLLRRRPPHTHDEGDHDAYCPGCFAERTRYGP